MGPAAPTQPYSRFPLNAAIKSLFRTTLLERPLIPIASAFAVGILLADNIGVAGLVCSAISSALIVRFFNRSFQGPILLIGCFVLLGIIRAAPFRTPRPNDISLVADHKNARFTGRICSDVELHGNSYSCQVAVTSVEMYDGSVLKAGGQVEARLPRSQGSPTIDYGDTVEIRGRIEDPGSASNEGGFDYKSYLANRHIFSVIVARRPTSWNRLDDAQSPWDLPGRISSACRRSIVATFSSIMSPTHAALISGIILGARADLPGRLNDEFVSTATVHILATAGLHVGVLLSLIYLVCRGLKLRRTHSAIVQLSSLLLYAMMAGARPSVVRAALVAGFYVFGELLSREFDLPSAIGAAALTLLAYEPGYLFDMGFQLSFATVITIVALMPLFEPPFARLRGLKLPFAAGTNRALVRFIVLSASLPALSIAAQIGSAPITAHYFNQISLFGVFANMIIVPLLWPTMGVGICVWLISLISWKAASCTAALALTPFLAVIVGTAGFFSLSPLAVVSVRSPGWFLISSYYVLLAWIIVSLRQRINRTFTGSP